MKKHICLVCFMLSTGFAFSNAKTVAKSTIGNRGRLEITDTRSEQIGLIVKAATLWIGLPDEANAMAFLKISEGTKVLVLEHKRGFYRVNHREVIGYVKQELVKIVSPAQDAFENSEENSNRAPKPGPIQAENKTPTNTLSSNSPKAASSEHYQVTLETSLRAAPDHRSKVLKRLPAGGQVQFLERTDRYWWKVQYEGKTGWAKCALLKKQ